MVILAIYVDDLLLVEQNKVLLRQLEAKLVRFFDTIHMEDVSIVLGIKVDHERKKWALIISQTHDTMSIVETYGMRECNPVYTAGVGPELSINQGEANLSPRASLQWSSPPSAASCTWL